MPASFWDLVRLQVNNSQEADIDAKFTYLIWQLTTLPGLGSPDPAGHIPGPAPTRFPASPKKKIHQPPRPAFAHHCLLSRRVLWWLLAPQLHAGSSRSTNRPVSPKKQPSSPLSTENSPRSYLTPTHIPHLILFRHSPPFSLLQLVHNSHSLFPHVCCVTEQTGRRSLFFHICESHDTALVSLLDLSPYDTAVDFSLSRLICDPAHQMVGRVVNAVYRTSIDITS